MSDKTAHGTQEWVLVTTSLFERELKKFSKRIPGETKAVLERLETYKETLNMCDEPQKVIFGWLHPEPLGVKAITQQGKGASLKATRLYIYAEKESHKIRVITIGDKKTQKEDIKLCENYIKSLRTSKDFR